MIEKHGIGIAEPLLRFLEQEALPGTGIPPEAFWGGFAGVFARFVPANRHLLAKRTALQARVDGWHDAHAGAPIDRLAYQAFLREIRSAARGG